MLKNTIAKSKPRYEAASIIYFNGRIHIRVKPHTPFGKIRIVPSCVYQCIYVCMHVAVKFFSIHNLLVSTVAVNEAGDTPISIECSRGDLEMIKALINKHIDTNSKCLSVKLTLLMVVFNRASQQGW